MKKRKRLWEQTLATIGMGDPGPRETNQGLGSKMLEYKRKTTNYCWYIEFIENPGNQKKEIIRRIKNTKLLGIIG